MEIYMVLLLLSAQWMQSTCKHCHRKCWLTPKMSMCLQVSTCVSRNICIWTKWYDVNTLKYWQCFILSYQVCLFMPIMISHDICYRSRFYRNASQNPCIIDLNIHKHCMLHILRSFYVFELCAKIKLHYWCMCARNWTKMRLFRSI